MLTQLSLQYFKPFAEMPPIRLAPLTLIYGPNSGGKSSLIQSLLLLRQSLEGAAGRNRTLIAKGEYVDLGSFRSLIHRHDTSRDLTFSLSYLQPESLPAVGKAKRRATNIAPGSSCTVELKYRASETAEARDRGVPELVQVAYSVDDSEGFRSRLRRVPRKELSGRARMLMSRPWALALYEWVDESDAVSYIEFINRVGRKHVEEKRDQLAALESALLAEPNAAEASTTEPRIAVNKQALEDLRRQIAQELKYRENQTKALRNVKYVAANALPSQRVSLEDVARAMAAPNRQYAAVPEVISEIAAGFLQQVETIRYLGPLRSYPERHYVVMDAMVDTVGRKGEHTPQLLHRNGNNAKKRTNRWFREFGIPYKLDTHVLGSDTIGEILVVTLVDQRSSTAVSPTDVGFGVGQLLPILVEGAVATNSVICVEQPEIHLHPRLQAHLADFFIDTACVSHHDVENRWKSSNQWIIETHSEALMVRLQRRMREGVITPADVSVLYVEPSVEGARVTQLELDERGTFLTEWPDGFFEETFEDLMG
jgi:predicted ATPase